MGHLRIPRSVTPLVAMLAGNPELFHAAREPLENLLGPVELESPFYPFDKTDYYTRSMGTGLQRHFFSFRNLSHPGDLVDWKLRSNAIEEDITQKSGVPGGPERLINLDVGYLTGAKLVLASTKDFAHRLYLRDGIFAEITMGFRGDSWRSHDFTFPDYKFGTYDDFLKKVRERHLEKVTRAREEERQKFLTAEDAEDAEGDGRDGGIETP